MTIVEHVLSIIWLLQVRIEMVRNVSVCCLVCDQTLNWLHTSDCVALSEVLWVELQLCAW